MNFITQVSLILYSIGLAWTVYWAIENYPIVGRWGDALEYVMWKIKKSKKLTKPKVRYSKNCFRVILTWWSMVFILIPISLIYLYLFDRLIGETFSIYAIIFTPFMFLLIPQFVSRFSGFSVLLIAPYDYFWYKDNQPDLIKRSFNEPFSSELNKNLKKGKEKWLIIQVFEGVLGFNICCLIPFAIICVEFYL